MLWKIPKEWDIDSNSKIYALFQTIIFLLIFVSCFFAMQTLQTIFGFDDLLFFVLFFLSSVLFGTHFAKIIIEPLFASKQALDKYIKNTLHELNIPIATIQSNVTILKKNITDEKNLQRLSRIQKASISLQSLYGELEYLLKKESGSALVEDFELTSLIQEIVEKFDAIQNQIKFTQQIESQQITCDKKGFAKAVENIISNAVKFNKPDGTIAITYQKPILCIKDSGIGIEHKNLFTIFERYYRIDTNTLGHGIGLSIVKEFCDANKIDIKIQSTVNVGTTICLDLSSINN
jgi:signal transduction histidine kinase